MMGRKSVGRKIFYMFDLEQRIPENHLLRQVSRAIDFSFIYDLVQPYYSHTGAPSVDPVVVFKMALLGYLYGITSNKIFLDATLLKANASMESLTERRPYQELQTPEQSGILSTIPYPEPR